MFWLEGGIFADMGWFPFWLSSIFISVLLIWMMNLYNFMDGIDGMAGSTAVFVTFSLIIILLLKGDFSNIVIILSMLSLSCLGFLFYNWPPASVFMGDSGSVFLGYIFGVLMMMTTFTGEISIWTWAVIFGYIFADTNLTIIIRAYP